MREIGMSELEKAREIQRQAVELHLPSPPVMWYEMKITNPDGSVADHLRAKSNSYVRNALNMLALQVGLADGLLVGDPAYNISSPSSTLPAFGDGTLTMKNINGSAANYLSRSADTGCDIFIGNSDTPETIDSYTIDRTWQNDATRFPGAFSGGYTTYTSNFDANTRILSASVSVFFGIPTIECEVKELALAAYCRNFVRSHWFLLARDLLETPVIVQPGQSLSFTYHTEVVYPA